MVLFSTLASVAASLGAAEADATLTLAEAFQSVEKVNLNVLLGREAAVQALEQANVTRATIMPIVNGSAVQRRSKAAPLTNTGVTSPRPTNRFDALVTGNVPLLDLQRWSVARSVRVGAEVAQADYHAIVQTSLATIAQAYFTHLRNLRRLAVLDANIVRARSLVELASNQFKAGIATQIDVTRAEAQLGQAEQARLQQVTTDLQSELVLKRALDLPVAQPLQLEDFTVRRAEGSLFMFAEDKSTFEKRPDYLRAQKAVEQARIDVRSTTYQRLPALTLGGNFGRGAANFDDELQPQWSANISLNVPIFDGLRANADRRVALSRQRAQQMRLHSLELQISSELRLAAQDASSRNAQVTVAEKNLRLAQDQLRLARNRFQNGVADNREVVEAQAQLALGEDTLVEAIYQYNLSRVELARSRGDVRSVLSEKAP